MEGDWQLARELTQLRKDSDTRETLAREGVPCASAALMTG